MKKLYLLPLALFLSFTFCKSTLTASHLAGGEITYTNVGQDAYRITLTIYGDCNGVGLNSLYDPAEVIISSTSCNDVFSLTLPLDSSRDVSAVCKSKLSQSYCAPGGTIGPAYKAFVYSAVTNLSPCSDWKISFLEAARNASTTNLVIPSSLLSPFTLYLETTADLILGRNNNSPKFFAYPTPTFYTNTLGSFNNASYDTDGDSLSYELTTPLISAGTPLTFNSGLSVDEPIPSTTGVSFDPRTGLLSVTPSTVSINALAMKITEWRNNQVIGTYIRDIQVIVGLNRSNQPPNTGSGSTVQINDITGGYKIVNKVRPKSLIEHNRVNDFSICPGDSLNLDIDIRDPDINQKLEFLRTNASLSLQGAKVTFTKITDNHIIAKFRFLADFTHVGFKAFSIIIGDNQCNHIYKSYFTYSIRIRPKLYAGEDLTICRLDDTAKITLLYPGKNTTWTVLSGDPIKLGQNFSCSNDCNSIKAWPNVTTTYKVKTEYSSTVLTPCSDVDTIIVKRIPEYKLTSIPKDINVCRGQTTSVTTYPSPVVDFDFNYSWEPKHLFLSPNDKFSKVFFTSPGQQKVFVTTSHGKKKGCVKKDTVTFNVSDVYGPSIDWLNPSNSLACGAKSYKFNIRPGATVPADCQVATSIDCIESLSSTSPPNLGGLANNTNNYPSPFSFFSKSSKHQFLYRAEDIIKSGFTGGKITAISFFIRSLSNPAPITSFNVSIKMGCTSKDTLTKTTFETGLMPVSGIPLIRRDVILVKGWNQLNLEVGFEWNGHDNIIIEICSEKGASSAENNPSFALKETSYNSSISAFSNSTVGSACTLSSFSANSFPKRRPFIRFKKCTIFADPSDFTYTWTPANLLDDATIQNPTATITKDQTFKLTITDKTGGSCSDSLNMDLKLVCCTELSSLSITESLCPTDPSGILRFIANSPNRPLRVILTKNNDKDTIRNTLIAANFAVGSLSADKYKLYVIDSEGCVKDTALEIKKFSLEGIHIGGIKAICRGDVTTLNLVGSGFSDIKWSNGSTSTSTEYGPGPVKVSFLYKTCKQEIETTVPEFAKPNADFSISPEISARTGETVYFIPKHGGVKSFKWNLGGGSSPLSNVRNPSNTYSQGGNYNIQLITENSGGCKDTVIKDYTIIAPLDLPNVITPNGDSKNDFLVISALDHSLYNSTMEVFDRWGKSVFKANNYANDWGAEGLPNGTYYYIVSLDDAAKSIFKGFFDIIK